MENNDWISRNHNYTLIDGKSGFTLCTAGMNFRDSDIESMEKKFEKAHAEMIRIESGEIKNPDENRKVTHFTDRTTYFGSELFIEVDEFVMDLVAGRVKGSTGKKFEHAVINGIGGSALGPQFMQFAMHGPYWNELSDKKRRGYPRIYFLDNTDSSGFADMLQAVDLEKTLIVNISKSGGTQETKNNMMSFKNACEEKGLSYPAHACAVTMRGSELDNTARTNKWLKVFEMAESIGGRTSETSIVGHVPAALSGIDFKQFLKGACNMDNWTRSTDFNRNPAYLLAAMWYIAGNARGDRNMVIVPYSDRLILLSRYLQQLVMESLGKEKDLQGNVVHQGLNVFGNKGGTDAHAFIQQLNDGRDDFFITFIEVMKDAMALEVSDGTYMGDYLHGFQNGLSEALRNKKRQVIQISIQELDEYNLGMIIALYERAVAVYAEFIDINAFHQPGVQAYKLASKGIIRTMKEVEKRLPALAGFKGTAKELVSQLEMQPDEVNVKGLLAKIAENSGSRDYKDFTLSRKWSGEEGWVYSVEKK